MMQTLQVNQFQELDQFGLPELVPGDSGTLIAVLQRLLILYGQPLGITYVFDQETVAAVQNFQTQYGIAADSIVGPQTWCTLINALMCNPDGSVPDSDAN